MRARHHVWHLTASALLTAACGPGTPADTDPPVETDTEPAVTDTEPDDSDPFDSEPLIDPCDPSLEPLLEVGYGQTTFTALTDGQTIELEQGGQIPPENHILGAVRVRHFPEQFSHIRYTLTDVPSGLVLASYDFNVALVTIPEGQPWACVGRYFGMTGVLRDWRQMRTAIGWPETTEFSALFCGTEVRLDVELREDPDAELPLVAKSVTVTVQPDPDVAPPCDSPVR
jgi:hypothetical protein